MQRLPWKIINVALALTFLWAPLWKAKSEQDYSFFLFAGSVVLVSLAVNFFALRKNARGDARHLLILPVFFLIGLFGSIAAISAIWVRLFLAIAGGVLFYFYQSNFPKSQPRFLEDIFSLASGFLAFSLLWSVNFFFTPPWWQILLGCLVFSLLFFFQAFRKMGQAEKSLPWAVFSCLIFVEAAWALLFWPVHFLTISIVHFSMFYLVYMISVPYFEGGLTRNKVYFQTGVILVILLFSLLSSPWHPL